METLWLILTWIAGTLAFAFLLAGAMGMWDFEPKETRGTTGRWIDVLLLSGLLSLAAGFEKNWHSRNEARQLFYAGLFALGATILFACLTAYST